MNLSFLRLAILVIAPCSLMAQQMRDPSQQVSLGDKAMSYDSALPLATKMLDGSVDEQKQAVAALKVFGVSLSSTPALDKLTKLVEKNDDFSAFDEAAKSSPNARGFLDSSVGKPLADLFEIKSNALTAIVMAGSDKGAHLLQDYLTSKSLAYRLMAVDANQAHLQDGTWNRGKQPTKKQLALFAYNGHGLPQSEYVKTIKQALDSNAADKLHLAITSLSGANNASAVKDTSIFDSLFAIFMQPAGKADASQRDIKLSIIRIINQSGDKRTSDFLKAAANDSDDIVSAEARSFLIDE